MSTSKNSPALSWAAVVRGTATPSQGSSSRLAPVSTINRAEPNWLETPLPNDPATTSSSSTEPSSPGSTETPPTTVVEASVSEAKGPFESDAVLICIDIECHCRNQTFAEYSQGIKRRERRVCEIGIASFDTRAMALDKAGEQAKEMWPKIKSENFAIIEHKHIVPPKHVSWCSVGDANDFEFGKTRWIRKAVIKEEFIKQVKTIIGESPPSRTSTPPTEPYRNDRKIIWVFFGGSNDEIWLSQLGIDLTAEFPNSETRDLQWGRIGQYLARLYRKPQISASDLFDWLGFDVSGQHNGGNDATWELRAFLAQIATAPK